VAPREPIERIELGLDAGADRREDSPPESWPLVGFLLVEIRDAGRQWWAAPHIEVLGGIGLREALEVACSSVRDDLLPELLDVDPAPAGSPSFDPPDRSWGRWAALRRWAASGGRS